MLLYSPEFARLTPKSIGSGSPLEHRVFSEIAVSDMPLSAANILERVRCKTTLVYSTLKLLLSRNLIRASGLGVKGQPILYSLNVSGFENSTLDDHPKASEKEEHFF